MSITINIISPKDLPATVRYKSPAITLSDKNTINFSKSLCEEMGLDASIDYVIFGYDKHYQSDVYIRKAAADQLEDAFTLLDRKIQAVNGGGLSRRIKKALGLDVNIGYTFPVKQSEAGWFCVGTKQAKPTERFGKK